MVTPTSEAFLTPRVSYLDFGSRRNPRQGKDGSKVVTFYAASRHIRKHLPVAFVLENVKGCIVDCAGMGEAGLVASQSGQLSEYNPPYINKGYLEA